MKCCCEKFEWMIYTDRIELEDRFGQDPNNPKYRILDFERRLIKGGCTHCMFCGTNLRDMDLS